MEWEIKIENNPNKRLLIKFRPLQGILEIYGQYKIKNNWKDFSFVECKIANISLEILQDALTSALNELKEKIQKYEDFEKIFKTIVYIILEESEKDEN